jgi:hypothetical protein
MFLEQRRQAEEALAETPDAHRWMSRGAQLARDELIHYVLTARASAAPGGLGAVSTVADHQE